LTSTFSCKREPESCALTIRQTDPDRNVVEKISASAAVTRVHHTLRRQYRPRPGQVAVVTQSDKDHQIVRKRWSSVLPTAHDLAFVHAYWRDRSIISRRQVFNRRRRRCTYRRFPPRLPPPPPGQFPGKTHELARSNESTRTGATEVNRARHNLRADDAHHGRRPPAPISLPVLCSVARVRT
jgi:hypothetical protein